jgi:hypothetical protein
MKRAASHITIRGVVRLMALRCRRPSLADAPSTGFTLARVTEGLPEASPNSQMIERPTAGARQMALDVYEIRASALFAKWQLLVLGLDGWPRFIFL